MKDYFLLAIKNLRRRKLRSWLTVLGIFIGIAAVVSLISLGQGLQGFIDEQFEQLGGNTIIVQPKTMGPPGSVTDSSLILTSRDLDSIEQVRGVEDAAGVLMRSVPVEFNDEARITFIMGYDEEYLELFEGLESLEPIQGRQLRDVDKSKTVVGYNHVLGTLWAPEAAVLGKNLIIDGQKFEIVGVLDRTGNPFDDNGVSIPKEMFREIFDVGDEETQIIVKTQEGLDPEDVAQDIERKLRRERGEEEGKETFDIQTAGQLLESFSSIFSVVQAVFVGIATISLIVGGIGIMNTMYTAVLERTKEIGTMKAIGAKNSHILLIFLFESGLLGLVGGIIGVGMGVGIAKSVEYIAMQQLGAPYLQASITPILIIGALLFSFIVGSSSGILPAYQASKLKPADSLRYE